MSKMQTNHVPPPPQEPENTEQEYLVSRRAWLEGAALIAEGERRVELLNEIAQIWLATVTPNEAPPALMTFLDGFLTKEASDERDIAETSKKYMRLLSAAHEPVSMALGTPDGPVPEFWAGYNWPPTQQDFDARLAAWLREIILTQDFERLDSFVEALRMIPRESLVVGVHPTVFLRSIRASEMPDEDKALARFLIAFKKLREQSGRLPSKAEVDFEAGVDDPNNARKYRIRLGLQGLPAQSRSR